MQFSFDAFYNGALLFLFCLSRISTHPSSVAKYVWVERVWNKWLAATKSKYDRNLFSIQIQHLFVCTCLFALQIWNETLPTAKPNPYWSGLCLQSQNCKSIVIPIAVFGLYSLQFLMRKMYIVAIDRIKFLFHLFIALKFQLN